MSGVKPYEVAIAAFVVAIIGVVVGLWVTGYLGGDDPTVAATGTQAATGAATTGGSSGGMSNGMKWFLVVLACLVLFGIIVAILARRYPPARQLMERRVIGPFQRNVSTPLRQRGQRVKAAAKSRYTRFKERKLPAAEKEVNRVMRHVGRATNEEVDVSIGYLENLGDARTKRHESNLEKLRARKKELGTA